MATARRRSPVLDALGEHAPAASRTAVLAGVVAGLAASQLAAGADPRPPALLGVVALIALALRCRHPRGPRLAIRVAALAATGALIGLGWGTWRLAAIDSGIADLAAGTRVVVTGHVADPPRRSAGTLRLRLSTPAGGVGVEAREPTPELTPGDLVRVAGMVRDPLPWEAARLLRLGVRDVVVAADVRVLPARRAGLAGSLDRIRERAEAALERGTAPAPASLLRGFVLGQDDRINDATVGNFRRSGLAHLLAVSGTNVMLLSLLAAAVLGLLGVPLRSRMLWILALIAVYVPVAGAGPSIQRAGVMGAAGVIAVLGSRPGSRAYALLLAAGATLALNPRACGEVGWQLSFAAVTGILIWTGALRELLQSPDSERRSALRRGVAEGAGLTIAATVATAPLMAHHFGSFPLVSLPANLLALPAVAPTMWLGMIAGAGGQAPFVPVEPVTALAGAFAAYIGQVAAWMAAPGWALLELELRSPLAVGGAYALLGGGLTLAVRWWRRRRAHRPRAGPVAFTVATAATAIALLVPAAVESLAGPGEDAYEAAPGSLLVSVLDVGQGDAILLNPGDGEPVLVDAGPPGAGIGEQLRERGIDRLGALVVTHGDSDHAGGVPDVLSAAAVATLAQAGADPVLSRAARAAGAAAVRLVAGDRIRTGSLRLDILWPPARLVEAAWEGVEPNRLSLVALARFRGFAMLLTGDAEAEVTPIDPGAVDVLKVAHHGSHDTGLPELLARSRPQLAVISAGDRNPFGHPAASTLADLAEAGVPVLRTDRDGEIRIEASAGGWRAAGP